MIYLLIGKNKTKTFPYTFKKHPKPVTDVLTPCLSNQLHWPNSREFMGQTVQTPWSGPGMVSWMWNDLDGLSQRCERANVICKHSTGDTAKASAFYYILLGSGGWGWLFLHAKGRFCISWTLHVAEGKSTIVSFHSGFAGGVCLNYSWQLLQ